MNVLSCGYLHSVFDTPIRSFFFLVFFPPVFIGALPTPLLVLFHVYLSIFSFLQSFGEVALTHSLFCLFFCSLYHTHALCSSPASCAVTAVAIGLFSHLPSLYPHIRPPLHPHPLLLVSPYLRILSRLDFYLSLRLSINALLPKHLVNSELLSSF